MARPLAFCVILWLLLAGLPARAGSLAPDLKKQLDAEPTSTRGVRVIVQHAQPGLTDLLSLSYEALPLLDLPNAGSVVMQLPLKNVGRLASDSNVVSVSPDRVVFRASDEDVPTAGASQVWAATGGGSGVGVAVLDTGVAVGADWSGPGAGSRLVGWQDLVNGRSAPYDDNGHGTHVAGIAMGNGALSGGAVTGTAPAANLIAVKVLAGDGSGRVSTVIRGLEWCIRNASTYGIRVVNLSLSHPPGESYRTDPLCKAVRRAVRAGLVVVCSAGNRGRNADGQIVYGGIGSPGNDPSVITVGALNTQETADRGDDTVCTYSSRGPTYIDHLAKPDLVAAGNRIVSVRAPGSRFDTLYPDNRVDPDGDPTNGVHYFRLSGTSMAAPQVAGVSALALAVNPALSPNAIKALLTFTAEPFTVREEYGAPLSPGLSLLTQGAGSLNADGAVRLAASLNGAAAVGQPWLQSPLPYASTIGGRTFSWWGRISWGDSLYEGAGIFTYRQEAWSPARLWGDQYTWGEDVEPQQSNVSNEQPAWVERSAWSDSAVWGDQYTWGEDVPVSGEPTTVPFQSPPP